MLGQTGMTGGGIQSAGWGNEFASMMHALEPFFSGTQWSAFKSSDRFVVLEGLFADTPPDQSGGFLVQRAGLPHCPHRQCSSGPLSPSVHGTCAPSVSECPPVQYVLGFKR